MLETFNKSAVMLGVLGLIFLFTQAYVNIGIMFLGLAGVCLLVSGCIKFGCWLKERRKDGL